MKIIFFQFVDKISLSKNKLFSKDAFNGDPEFILTLMLLKKYSKIIKHATNCQLKGKKKIECKVFLCPKKLMSECSEKTTFSTIY